MGASVIVKPEAAAGRREDKRRNEDDSLCFILCMFMLCSDELFLCACGTNFACTKRRTLSFFSTCFGFILLFLVDVCCSDACMQDKGFPRGSSTCIRSSIQVCILHAGTFDLASCYLLANTETCRRHAQGSSPLRYLLLLTRLFRNG